MGIGNIFIEHFKEIDTYVTNVIHYCYMKKDAATIVSAEI